MSDAYLDTIPRETHLHYLRQTLSLATKSPPQPTNFRVGCIIVSYASPSTPAHPYLPKPPLTSIPRDPANHGTVLSTGYTLELPGNTHAEQVALTKLHAQSGAAHSSSLPARSPANTYSPVPLRSLLPGSRNAVLYTSLEPCSVRLSGNQPCVERIVATTRGVDAAGNRGGIRKVVFGAKEPGTFVRDSQSCRLLDEAGVEWEYVPDLEGEILRVAMEGHPNKGQAKEGGEGEQQTKQELKGSRIDDISEEERKRQEAQPRNPKKRMMEFFRPSDGKGSS